MIKSNCAWPIQMSIRYFVDHVEKSGAFLNEHTKTSSRMKIARFHAANNLTNNFLKPGTFTIHFEMENIYKTLASEICYVYHTVKHFLR